MAYKIKSKKKKNLTRRKLDYFIADEKKATKEYERYGLKNLAKDEKKHYEFLKKLKKQEKFKKKRKTPSLMKSLWSMR